MDLSAPAEATQMSPAPSERNPKPQQELCAWPHSSSQSKRGRQGTGTLNPTGSTHCRACQGHQGTGMKLRDKGGNTKIRREGPWTE